MTRELIIDGRLINDDSDCYVIAEIGHNHQGDIEQCKELFRVAKSSGAEAVKLQKRDNKSLFTKVMYDSAYNSENAYAPTYGKHREALEFGLDEYVELIKYAKELNIAFFSTAFDMNSAEFLNSLDVPAFKIASGDLTNVPLITKVAEYGKPVIISTGGGSMEDVIRTYNAVKPISNQIAFLQCTAGYPPAWEELNLRAIETYRDALPDVVIGLSSHDSGIAMGPVAYVLGARIIEKHFTLNRALKGTDHSFSLEHSGMEKLTRDLKRTRAALGDGVKSTYESEKMPLNKMAKKIVIAKPLQAGHIIELDDLTFKSPSDGGLKPFEIHDLVGKELNRAMEIDETILYSDLK